MTLLPDLRADLQLSAAEPAHDGAPQWTLADPLRGRYFKLGADAMRLLRHWSLRDPQRLLAAANADAGAPLQESDLQQLLHFLREHDLIGATDPQQRATYAPKAASQRQSPWKALLHQYLFFRIPLWRPDAFLERTWPHLRRHGPWLLRYGMPLLLVLGVFLVARDWERFVTAFPHLFSLAGALAFGTALIFAKLCHEFGHAYMAKRAGCRVQSMGVAFMVLFPLFYTDVSDAWRVRDRRARLLIGAGGILAELALAVIALLAWSLLPDGALRTAVFMLASATWITTLLVNLNPFMRFDGYFLLSDFWGVDNLQSRAFALCRWRLRETLFGYGEAAPEPWPPAMQRKLLFWGYAAWLWRAALFLGIALAVYHMFFKLLGIFLMLVELVWFIGLPIWRELQHWWQQRAQARPRRTLLTVLVANALLLVLVLPWRSSVELPAQLEAARVSSLHAALPARVHRLHVKDGQRVQAGEPLLELVSPDLDARQSIVRQEIRILQQQLRRQAGRLETAAGAGVLEQSLAQALAEYRGLAAQRELLLLRAGHSGTVRDLSSGLIEGRWVPPRLELLKLVSDEVRLRGYLNEAALQRITPDSRGYFHSDSRPLQAAVPVRMQQIDTASTTRLEQTALASTYGGPIAAREDGEGGLQPLQAQYAVLLQVSDTTSAPLYPIRGIARMQGNGESLLQSAWRRIAALGVRESGF